MGKNKVKFNKRKEVVLKTQKEDTEKPIVFSFIFLEEGFIKKQKTNGEIYKDFIIRLHKLSVLGWNKIVNDDRHGFGFEKIPLSQIKPQLSTNITRDIDFLYIFRADGANHVFAGFREENTFFIVFIETEFGTLYNH